MPVPDTPNIVQPYTGDNIAHNAPLTHSNDPNVNAQVPYAADVQDVSGRNSRRKRADRRKDGVSEGRNNNPGPHSSQQSNNKRQSGPTASVVHENENEIGSSGGGSFQPQRSARGAKRREKTHANEAQNVDGPSNSLTPSSGSATLRGRRINTRPQPTHPVQSSQQPTNQRRDRSSKMKQAGKRANHTPTTSTPEEDTLTARLIQSLKTPPYPDCPICFNSIRPMQPIWSCSPDDQYPQSSLFNDRESNAEDDPRAGIPVQCCYTPFHLKCIQSWASKSVKDTKEAYRARGLEGRRGEWRCPGCQQRRFDVPSAYRCFCHSTVDPQPPRISTPHSCGNPCSRPRLGCNHACPLSCHPGPCPPCSVLVTVGCWCGKERKSIRCATIEGQTRVNVEKANTSGISCGQPCSKVLGCGTHMCDKMCHPGDCEPCAVKEVVKCYCGKNFQEMSCGEGLSQLCGKDGEETWIGRFVCQDICDRPYDCGIHTCELLCHVHPLSTQICPRDPSLVTHCPCGKRELSQLSSPVDGQGVRRVRCTDEIPTCGLTCGKKLGGCEHTCAKPCHLGPCPPCSIPLTLPCRCGSSTRTILCSTITSPQDATDLVEVLCERPCPALRACGRHQCNRICCPLASLAALSKSKAGKRRMEDAAYVDEDGWHECDLVCNKLLSCGNHRCEKRDHRGPCPPCLRSSFEEMVCPCGRTVIEPPIPCGTRITCSYPCALPPPSCGHPKTPHACHAFDDMSNNDNHDNGLMVSRSCPPCPFLASKQCACGKNVVKNVRCSQEKVSCGVPCGKLLGCGYHQCERLCHGDDCGPCTAPCGKPRKLCFPEHHPCTLPCHAPSSCSESEPCQAQITLTCPCGRIQQPATCGRSTSNPTGRENASAGQYQIHCNNECAIAKRNAKLAEAFGINRPEERGMNTGNSHSVVWVDDLVSFARSNMKFCLLVEKTFSDFIASDKKSQVLPYMPETRRGFVQKVAAVYRMDTQMVDQEPRRSVQIIRRIDTRVPSPLISSAASPSTNLGKLANLRTHAQISAIHPSPSTQPHALPSSSSTNSRSWTTIASAPAPLIATSGRHPNPDQTKLNIERPLQIRSQSPHSEVSSKFQVSTRPLAGNTNLVEPVSETHSVPIPDDWEQDDT